MGRADGPESTVLRVEVVYCPAPGEVDQVQLMLPHGACVIDALQLSGVLARHGAIDLAVNRVGVWGKLREPDAPLHDQDRVEIYRPLSMDPKEARRQRHAKQQQRK